MEGLLSRGVPSKMSETDFFLGMNALVIACPIYPTQQVQGTYLFNLFSREWQITLRQQYSGPSRQKMNANGWKYRGYQLHPGIQFRRSKAKMGPTMHVGHGLLHLLQIQVIYFCSFLSFTVPYPKPDEVELKLISLKWLSLSLWIIIITISQLFKSRPGIALCPLNINWPVQEFQDLRRKGIRLEIGGGDDDGDDGSWWWWWW